MNEFDYNGYVITENYAGNYEVNGWEFPSLDDAMDWIDSLNTTEETDGPYMYFVSYLVDKGNSHYDEYVWAYSEQDAINQIKEDTVGFYKVLDCYRAD